jgi:hypothetical protein
MMHAVHDAVRISTQVIGPLGDESEHITKLFPKTGHPETLVGGITMQEKSLEKQTRIPEHNEEDDNGHEQPKIKR